jgi:hypothetical protein
MKKDGFTSSFFIRSDPAIDISVQPWFHFLFKGLFERPNGILKKQKHDIAQDKEMTQANEKCESIVIDARIGIDQHDHDDDYDVAKTFFHENITPIKKSKTKRKPLDQIRRRIA